ncbi:uromodulin-like [Hoplias malabaricus]|uniref:uromodulin-like n=1 Tax=Hoplias malabaricus TaxID=27720 RepID=UPI0034626313
MSPLLQLSLVALLFVGGVTRTYGKGGHGGFGQGGHGGFGQGGYFGSGEGSGYEQDGSGSSEEKICEDLKCTYGEICQKKAGQFGCACALPALRKNPDTFDAIQHCESISGSLSLSRCQLFEAGYPAYTLHLNDRDCKGEVSGGRVEFNFNVEKEDCGTELKTNKTHFIYENSVRKSNSHNSHEVISRKSWLNIEFSCVYPLIKTISMPMSIEAKKNVVNKDLPGLEGTYTVEMYPCADSLCKHPYSGELTIEVNKPVYVAVNVEGVDKDAFSAVLDRCWATPDSNKDNSVHWDLIDNGCPNPHDATVQVYNNGASTFNRFSFSMFTFTYKSNRVFLHCEVKLCRQKHGRCVQRCDNSSEEKDDDDSKRHRRSVDFHDTAAISMGF